MTAPEFDTPESTFTSAQYRLWAGVTACLTMYLTDHPTSPTPRSYVWQVIIEELGYVMIFPAVSGAWGEAEKRDLADIVVMLDRLILVNRARYSTAWHDPGMPDPKQCFGFTFRKNPQDPEVEHGDRMVGHELEPREWGESAICPLPG